MTYTPADPYTPYFPGSTTLKPDTILNGQDILYSHVAPLWDEVIKIQDVLRGQAGAALFSLSASTSTTPLAVQGLAGQTADLFKVSSSSSELFKVAASGKVTSGEIAATAATNVFGSYLAVADAQPAFRVSKTGELTWGAGGSSLTDTVLYRGSAGLLRSDGDFLIGTNSSTYAGAGVRVDNSGAVDVGRATNDSANALTISIDSESQYRFRINSAGSLGWSAGSGSIDATLARSGSAALTLTGSLTISSTLTVNGKTPVYTDNAALTDSRAPTGPASGDLTGTYPAPTIKSDVALSGAPTTTTALASDNSTKIATTSFVNAFVNAQNYATLASPSLTGTPVSITAAVDTNTAQIATTAFVIAQASASGPAATSTSAAIGTSTRFARADHVHAIGNDSVSLGTHTTGNYIASVTGPAEQLSISGSGSENAAVTIGLAALTGPTGTYTSVAVDIYGRVTSGSNPTYVAGVAGTSGRVLLSTGPSGPTGSVLTTIDLATAGTAGTYQKVTTDAYGRVTSGTALSATDIPSLTLSKITDSGTAAAKNIPVAGNASISEVVYGTDTRLSDSRTPTGTAGGDLSGTYPNPTLGAVGTAGTYQKVTTDSKGRVTGGTTLSASDIPAITLSKITDAGSAAAKNVPSVGNAATGEVVLGSDARLTNARNVSGGAAGQIPYQTAVDTTAFVPAGTSGYLLKSNGSSAPSYTDPSALSVNHATTADSATTAGSATTATTATELAGGLVGQIPYQAGAGNTSFLATGSTGSVLTANGAAAPTYTAQASLSVGYAANAGNLSGGLVGQIPYQAGANSTSFLAAGTSGYVLKANGSAAPTWVAQSSISAGSATYATSAGSATSAAEVKRSDGNYYIYGDSAGWHFGGIGATNTGLIDCGAISSTSINTNDSNIAMGIGDLTCQNITNSGAIVSTGNIRTVSGYSQTASSRVVYFTSNGTLGTTSSSRRFKQDITPHLFDSSKVLQINPVSFKWIPSMVAETDPQELAKANYGVIAEDVAALGLDEFVLRDDNGEVDGFKYDTFPIALLQVCKDQQTLIENLESRLAALEAKTS